MESLQSLLAEAASPVIALILPASRFFWLYLVSALVLALVVNFHRARKPSGARWREAIAASFPKRVFFHRSAIVDYKFIVINHLMQVFVFGWFLLAVATATGWTTAALEATFGAGGAGLEPDTMARVLLTVFTLLAADFGLFYAHYLQHRVPVLWEFHKVHHSAQVLTPITVLRMHPVDIILNALIPSALLGVTNGAFLYLYSGPVAEFTVLGANLFTFLFFLGGYHLRHSHVWLLFPNPVRKVISSPALHLIHHSADPKHYDKNFARIFTFWDWLAGSLYIPEGYEEIEIGMGGEEVEFDSVWRLYALPFRKAAQLFSAPRARAG